ncbi:MAG TPA: dihydrodipicolinate reductase C-terminal domain-containing protein, partial [Saprospiraceae bacterium]|nr:dihydrodipicolinate reductase C-terminal domain-containing protein [Saprospiraceae bacterium]
MNIAIIGYGKMGKMIEQVALERGHQIGLIIGENNLEDFTDENLQRIDAAIEFTMPESAVANIKRCIINNCPIVSGTTGWLKELGTLKSLLAQHNSGFIYSSNYSLGVNIFFALNKKLAQYMAPYTQYQASIEEIHHTAKLDAPSGTAITLAEGVIAHHPTLKEWTLADVDHNGYSEESLPITALRIDPCPGTHTVKYSSPIDDLEIKHTAHTRYGFALG